MKSFLKETDNGFFRSVFLVLVLLSLYPVGCSYPWLGNITNPKTEDSGQHYLKLLFLSWVVRKVNCRCTNISGLLPAVNKHLISGTWQSNRIVSQCTPVTLIWISAPGIDGDFMQTLPSSSKASSFFRLQALGSPSPERKPRTALKLERALVHETQYLILTYYQSLTYGENLSRPFIFYLS